jgi:hypothetical protein
MKHNEFWLGVCLLASFLTAIFSGSLWPLFNQPLYPKLESFFRTDSSSGFSNQSHRVPVREEQPRG